MKFSLTEWRRFYDKVQQLGKILHDGRVTYDDYGRVIPAISELSIEAQAALESEIRSLCQKSSKYLDQCGIRPNRPLWHYDRKNPETHASAPEFKYQHLLPEGL